MERLTKRGGNRQFISLFCDNGLNPHLNKLADYEDLEEQNLLIKLPCKVGDNIYVIKNACGDSRRCDDCINPYNCNGRTDYSIYEGVVKNIEISPQVYISVGGKYLNILFNANKFGKTLFLTREEAEEKLKEIKRMEEK